jgi:hypothetical protein
MTARAEPAIQLPGQHPVPPHTRRQEIGTLRQLDAAFEDATGRRPDVVREADYTFAGQPVRVRTVGCVLADHLTRPFAHLRACGSATTPPALTIDVWDESETGVARPPSMNGDGAELAWPAGHGVFALSAGGRRIRYDGPDWSTWLDRDAGRMLGWRASGHTLPMHERTRPFPFLLPLWYAHQGLQVIHAGLVARGDVGVLFGGANGAGKTTSALTCLCAGFDYLSDDHVGLQELGDGTFIGHSLFGSTRLEPDHLQRFPLLLPHAHHSSDPADYKSLVLLADVAPARLKPSVPIRALALPRIVDAPVTRIRPVSKAVALRMIAPSSLLMIPIGPGKQGFDKLSRLVARVPTFWLELGRDLDEIPCRVDELIARVTDVA